MPPPVGAGVVGGEVVARAGKATRTSAITKLVRWLMAVPSGGDAAGGVRDGGARQGNETGAGPVPLAIATTTSARAVCSRQFAFTRPTSLRGVGSLRAKRKNLPFRLRRDG